jgi:tetratricopeptide (TPR) repeat protein
VTRCASRRLPAIACVVLLSACASPQAPAPSTGADQRTVQAPQASMRAEADPVERSLTDRATLAESRNDWAEAALVWEALTLVRPDDGRAADRLTAARRQIAERADAQHAQADAALRRGDTDNAVVAYLEVLALDPSRVAAAEALRKIERERTRRAQVGRFARPPSGRRMEADAAMADTSERGRSANSLREHASLLAAQGDVEAAIQLLRESPLLRRDASLRGRLADLYVQKAGTLKASQPAAARAALDASLALDPKHAGALALQQQLPKARSRAAPPSK